MGVFAFFEQIIKGLREANKVGNAAAYISTKLSLKKFVGHDRLLFTDIDQSFLYDYELFLRRRALKDTGIVFCFRTLRALFNKAIRESIVDARYYPFKEFKIAKFSIATQKKSHHQRRAEANRKPIP